VTGRRLLKEKEEGRQKQLEELRREVQIGIDQANNRELSSLDSLGTLNRIRGAQAKQGK
jgi:hypothetical protein